MLLQFALSSQKDPPVFSQTKLAKLLERRVFTRCRYMAHCEGAEVSSTSHECTARDGSDRL